MSSGAEQNAIALKRGKWSRSDVPHTGWSCDRIEDRGEPSGVCGMCESQPIRYVHHMTHPDYPGELAVGYVCAGHMEQDLERARARDQQMVRRAGQRSRWLRRRWKVSQKGNEYIETEGYRITVYHTGSTWAAIISAVDGTYSRHSKRRYNSPDEVKLAAFDVITHLLSRRRPAEQ